MTPQFRKHRLLQRGFRRFAAILVLGIALTGIVRAETHKVDDSASQVLERVLPMEWESVAPGPGQSAHAVSGIVTVLVRLDVAPWAGRRGRIYMTLPAQAGGPVTALWTTRGPLLPGTLRAGERTLVHAGPIGASRIEDTLRLEIRADGRYLRRTEQLDFSFEIDLESP